MRTQRLDVTDLVATVFVAAATTLYAAGLAGADLGGTRVRASAVFLCGMLACSVGMRRDAFQGAAAKTRLVAVLTAVGVVTLIVGMTAIILGSASYLTALFVGVVAMWLGATGRHLMTPQQAVTPALLQHQELVKK